jgi:uncharacterized membrane protein
VLTIFFDLSRIASLGAIYYLVMDIIIHWGVLTKMRKDIAKAGIVISAIILDVVVLGSFVYIKIERDPTLIWIAVGSMLLIFLGEKWFLNRKSPEKGAVD